MGITGTINVALNGFEAGVTSKAEAKALITARIGELAEMLAPDAPLEVLGFISGAFGVGFEMRAGKLANIVFQ